MPLLITFTLILALVFLLWLLSLALRDASIVDIFWGCGFVIIAWFCALTTDGAGPRRLLMTALVTIWGLRLAIYLFWRNAGKGEDYRYQAMRKRIRSFPLVSLFLVFGIQGALIWIISLPVQAAVSSPWPEHLTALDLAGVALWATGLSFEALSDWQLARFKSDPANKGKVMERGLWRYTRHPNYFGDALLWWGLFLIALSTPNGWMTIISPVVMTVLLLKISGVALLERSLNRTKPEYAAYARRTNAFFPWFPKTND
jgi:steroid 5-alpha reductase family enzyme